MTTKNELIDLLEIADQIATTHPKAKELKVDQKSHIKNTSIAKKYPVLGKLQQDTHIIVIGRTKQGVYGAGLQLWQVDNIPTVYETTDIPINTNRVVIKSVIVGRSFGICEILLDGVALKIVANLTDECLLTKYPKDGINTEIVLDQLPANLREKPDSFVKLIEETVPINTPIKIVGKSGFTKKYESDVYRVTYILDGKEKIIERLLPNKRLRAMLKNGTSSFIVADRYKKTNKKTGEVGITVKIFDTDKPAMDDLDWEE